MTESKNYVEHEGLVVEASDSHVLVNVIVKSSCAGCQIKGGCNLSEIQEKLIDINHNKEGYKNGDKVLIAMETVLGYKALLLGYIIPFIIILLTLIVSISVFQNEGTAAGLALGFAVVYYLIIYILRKYIQKAFRYTLKPAP